jgi:hypothetical protein
MKSSQAKLPPLSVTKATHAAEAAYQASLPPAPKWRPDELAAFAARVFRDGGGKPGNWSGDQRWVEACTEVLGLCEVHDIDPRDWIRGVLRPHIQIAGEKPWRVSPGHLIGESAHELAMERIKAHGRADESDTVLLVLLAAEILFADIFLGEPLRLGHDRARRAREVETDIQAKYPGWNLASADRWPHIRWEALRSVLYDCDMTWPDLIPAPAEAWRWIDARSQVLTHTSLLMPKKRERARRDTGDFDHLGELA